MPDLQTVLAALSRDPILTYSLLAALFLAAVSLASGWVRLDFVPLLRPLPLIKLCLAVLAGIGLMLLGGYLNELLTLQNWLPRLRALGSDPAWPLGGLSRFPLYVAALAYGPSAGLLAGGLFAAFEARSTLPGWPEAVLTLELIVLGWLSIYPSPREHRWAGPLNACIAYGLAWLTGGVALLQATQAEVTPAAFWLEQQKSLGGFVLSVLLLSLIGPQLYRGFFFRSRLAGEPSSAERSTERPRPGTFVIGQLEQEKRRERPSLPPPDMPEPEVKARRHRRLEPAPRFEEQEG